MKIEAESRQGTQEDVANMSERAPAKAGRQRGAWTAPIFTTVELTGQTLGSSYTGADDTITGSWRSESDWPAVIYQNGVGDSLSI